MIVNKIKQKGVSLIEALIATTIFMVAFISFISLQISSLDTVRDGYIKKTITDSGLDFIAIIHAETYSKKKNESKKAIIDSYINEEWQIDKSKCSNDVFTECASSSGLTDENKCTKDEMTKYNVLMTQCQLLENIPSMKMKFESCGESNSLYCLNVAWNGDLPNYDRCKEFDSNCIVFEVLP